MVRELLVLCSYSSYQSSSGEEQILSFVVGRLRDDEELLLETQGEENLFGVDSQGFEEVDG